VRATARAWLALAVTGATTATACELVTHAFDFRVEATAGLCDACPGAAADLSHPPCPVADPAPDLDRAFIFAARRSRLGHPADLGLSTFDLGLDLDCSDRPLFALPVLCTPRVATGWTPLPGGVDDALFTRVLAPVYQASPPGRGVDLDAALSSALERGLYGVLVAVRQWNGRPDDPSVEVSIRSSPGLAAGAAPAWAGGDRWQTYPEVDPDGVRRFALDGVPGYVAGGVLVVDARDRDATLFRFGPAGAHFDLLLRDLSFTGALTAGGVSRFTASGIIDQPSAQRASAALTTAVGACAGGAAGVFLQACSARVPLAPDMPFEPGASPSDPCDGISFGWALDAEPARLGVEETDGGPAGADAGCPY